MLTSAVCLFRSEIDNGYSTKVILAEVYKDPAARQRPVAVPLGESTFSASFYVDLLYQGHFDHFAVQVKRPKGQEAEADAETARQLLDCREDNSAPEAVRLEAARRPAHGPARAHCPDCKLGRVPAPALSPQRSLTARFPAIPPNSPGLRRTHKFLLVNSCQSIILVRRSFRHERFP